MEVYIARDSRPAYKSFEKTKVFAVKPTSYKNCTESPAGKVFIYEDSKEPMEIPNDIFNLKPGKVIKAELIIKTQI